MHYSQTFSDACGIPDEALWFEFPFGGIMCVRLLFFLHLRAGEGTLSIH